MINDKIDITYVHVLHCGTVDISNTKTAFNITHFRVVFLLAISEPQPASYWGTVLCCSVMSVTCFTVYS